MKKLILLLGITLCISAFTFNSDKKAKFIAVIDAGHGGMDSGNNSDSLTESAINLQLTTHFKKAKNQKGIEFLFTRTSDEYIELHDRVKFAKDNYADLLISFHCDYYTDPAINGYEIYYPSTGDNIVKSKNFANILEEKLRNQKTPMAHKSTKAGKNFITDKANCPAVLVNFGFLSNPQDLETVLAEEHQKQFVNAIIESVQTYIVKQ